MADPFSVRITYDRNLTEQLGPNIRQQLGRAIAKLAKDAEGRMKAACPVDTGFLKSSILADKVQPLLWQVTVGAEYGIYVEMGTRYMRAQPYFMPALDGVQEVLTEVVRQSIQKAAQDSASD